MQIINFFSVFGALSFYLLNHNAKIVRLGILIYFQVEGGTAQQHSETAGIQCELQEA